jgi:uncharacterized membrane protein
MAMTDQSRTVVAVFHSIGEANRAVQRLLDAGVTRDDISLVANKSTADEHLTEGVEDPSQNIGTGAGVGAAIGGTSGLLLALAGLALPGVGPVLAAGPLVAALGGAGLGAAVGGMVGALVNLGIPEDEAHHYAEGVRRGDVLVTVKTDHVSADRLAEILDNHGSVSLDQRVSNWRERGYERFNPDATPYTSDELKHERQHYQPDVSPAPLRASDHIAGGRVRAGYDAREPGHETHEEARDYTSEIAQSTSDSASRFSDRAGDVAHEMGRGLREAGQEIKNAVSGGRKTRVYPRS